MKKLGGIMLMMLLLLTLLFTACGDDGEDKETISQTNEKRVMGEAEPTVEDQTRVEEPEETQVKVEPIFEITFEGGNDFQVMEGEDFRPTAMPLNPQHSFEGLNIKWEVEKATIVAPNQENGYFVYDFPGKYQILVKAYDLNIVVGEGIANVVVIAASE